MMSQTEQTVRGEDDNEPDNQHGHESHNSPTKDDNSSGENRQETDLTLKWHRFALRTALQGHTVEPVPGQQVYLRSFLLQILWPNGGYVWQTPVDVRVMDSSVADAPGVAPAGDSKAGESKETFHRLWTFNRTRPALLAIGLVTAFLLSRAR